MIKAEFRRLINTGIIFFIIFLVIILCTVITVLFYNDFDFGSNGSGYGIRRYQSLEEVSELINELQEEKSEIKAILSNQVIIDDDKPYYEMKLLELEMQENIYSYILENNIAYDDYNDYANISNNKYDSAFSAFRFFAQNINYFLPFIVALLAAIIIPLDFHNGAYKFIYSSSISRNKILFARFIAFLIFAIVIVLVTCISMMSISFLFGKASGSIVFANLSSVFQMNYATYFLFETINILFRTIIIGCFIFASSLFVRNAIMPSILDVGLCIGGYMVFWSNQPMLNTLFIGFNQNYLCIGATSMDILYSCLILIASVILCGLSGVIRFLRRDLL